jgi:hypothetical protein
MAGKEINSRVELTKELLVRSGLYDREFLDRISDERFEGLCDNGCEMGCSTCSPGRSNGSNAIR